MGCGFTAMLIDQGEGSYSSISLVRAVKVKRALAFSGQFVCQAQMWVLCSSLVNSKILLFFFLGFLFVFFVFSINLQRVYKHRSSSCSLLSLPYTCKLVNSVH